MCWTRKRWTSTKVWPHKFCAESQRLKMFDPGNSMSGTGTRSIRKDSHTYTGCFPLFASRRNSLELQFLAFPCSCGFVHAWKFCSWPIWGSESCYLSRIGLLHFFFCLCYSGPLLNHKFITAVESWSTGLEYSTSQSKRATHLFSCLSVPNSHGDIAMLCALLMDHVESNTAVQRSAALQFRTASRQLSAGVTLSSIRYIIVVSAKISISAMCAEFNVHMQSCTGKELSWISAPDRTCDCHSMA